MCVARARVAALSRAFEKRHPELYRKVTLAGLCLVPFVLSASQGFVRFLVVWFCFMCATAFFVRKALRQPLQPTAPRFVPSSLCTFPSLIVVRHFQACVCLLFDCVQNLLLRRSWWLRSRCLPRHVWPGFHSHSAALHDGLLLWSVLWSAVS